ncbi:MAG: hypothetical protein ACF8MJ_04890 [Phycisphaerales bacterium JB050]
MGNRNALEDVQTESELRAEVSQLREDLAVIREDFRGLVSDAVRTGKRGFESASESAKSAAQSAAEKSADLGKEAVHRTEDQITSHPFASVAAAFAGGAVVGLLFGRRHS